ncbi:hypothetical protein ABMA28_002681 [Loxostege sticticalis]|uniref:PiggyBac transposable element-derived protein domain-containing protein n=1 Tax=Loxostege sticticalis TaxID=481309 RepID=A0ABD0SY01_LOXSC
MSRRLKDREISEYLLEDFPSGSESICSDEDDDDAEDQPNPLVLGDLIGEVQVQDYDNFDSDDDLPLSSFVHQNPDSTQSNPVNSDGLPIKAPKWKKNYRMDIPGEFSENVGIADHILSMENITPLILFRQFWTEHLQDILCFQTNLYATQSGKPFTPTTSEELDVFIALNLVMGIKKLPSYRDYWSSAPDLHDSYISKFMTFNRFSWLLNYLHVNDNSVMPNRNNPDFDKLYKIRPLLEILRSNFEKNYKPSEKIAIDESMIKFKGRNYLKQYMPKKPIKRGYKVWMKCAQSGYCLDFDFYTGKQGTNVETDLGGKIVKNFCENLKDKNHKVYFDNYFNSYPLQLKLREDNILACGTVNSSRKFLPTLKEDKQLKRGEHDYRISDTKVSLLKWKDKRSVFILSNYHDPKHVGKVNRRERDGTSVEVSCPEAVRDYNANMNFVDKFDQLKGSYAVDRKSHKWWHRIFFHFLDCCVVNAFLIYKELQSSSRKDLSTLTLKEFRRSVYQGLLAPAYVNKQRPESVNSNRSSAASSPGPALIKRHKPTVPPEIRLECSRHQPERSTSRRCCKCSTKLSPVRTIWQCNTCKVPLCLRKGKTCFSDFHKK